MHRISLNGPWNLAIVDERMELSRKFHAPSGMVDESTYPPTTKAHPSQVSLFFGWQAAVDWPVDSLRFNDLRVLPRDAAWKEAPRGTFFSLDSVNGAGLVELTGILRSFNELVLVWSRWPSDWQPVPGRYTPHPQHPIHHDSWLDIQT